nr:hypothetical protein [Pseudomonas mosselii]
MYWRTDVAVELDFTAQAGQQISLGSGGVELNACSHRQILGERFAQLAQLDQRRVGVAGKHSLGRIGELEKYRIVFFEKGEVAALSHVPSLEFVAGHLEGGGAIKA